MDFDRAWTEEFHFVGNQSCGGRASGMCFCVPAQTEEAQWLSPRHLPLNEVINGVYTIEGGAGAASAGFCMPVEDCEAKRNTQLAHGVAGRAMTCEPWRDPSKPPYMPYR